MNLTEKQMTRLQELKDNKTYPVTKRGDKVLEKAGLVDVTSEGWSLITFKGLCVVGGMN